MSKPFFAHSLIARDLAQLWTTAGSGILTPLTPTSILVVPGSPSTGEAVRVGTRTVKVRLWEHATADAGYVTLNAFQSSPGVWAQDDGAKPGWALVLRSDSDNVGFSRTAPGGAQTAPLSVDNAGNLTILGNNATKATGTTWINPSDERTKANVQPYTQGLAAIAGLQPSTFDYNGEAGTVAGTSGIGFIAQQVEPIMPEMIRHYQYADPATAGDGGAGGMGRMTSTADAAAPAATDYLALDQTALTLALVNAIKELKARVEALEKRPGVGPPPV